TALVVARLALLVTIAARVAAALSLPLTPLIVLLLSSPLLFSQTPLLFSLSLLLSAPLFLVALILCATSLIGIAPLLFRLALLIKAAAIFLRFVSPLEFRVATLVFGL